VIICAKCWKELGWPGGAKLRGANSGKWGRRPAADGNAYSLREGETKRRGGDGLIENKVLPKTKREGEVAKSTHGIPSLELAKRGKRAKNDLTKGQWPYKKGRGTKLKKKGEPTFAVLPIGGLRESFAVCAGEGTLMKNGRGLHKEKEP